VKGPGRLAIAGTFALLTLIWGTTWAAIRIGLTGIPPFTGVALRFLVAAAVLFLLSPAMGVRYGWSAVERRLWLINGLLSFCVSYGVVYWSEQWVPSGLASVLFATFPLFVAMLAHFALPAERLTAKAVVGILTGFGGVAVIFSEDFSRLGGPRVALASLVMLVSPFVSAVASVTIKKWGRDIHPVSISAVPMAMSAVVMGGIALAVERDRPLRFDAVSVSAMLYLALAGSALTFTLYYWLMRHIPATRLSLIAYSTPVVAVAVGALFMNEPVTARTFAGSALVVLGVALAVHARHPGGAPPALDVEP
jgi:drug/metabolite transporter (DMT)-like permease